MNFDSPEQKLEADLHAALPDFCKMIAEYRNAENKPDCIVLHQDAFAADYQEREFALLGMAIKYAGIYGVDVRIIGTNRNFTKMKSITINQDNDYVISAMCDSLDIEQDQAVSLLTDLAFLAFSDFGMGKDRGYMIIKMREKFGEEKVEKLKIALNRFMETPKNIA